MKGKEWFERGSNIRTVVAMGQEYSGAASLQVDPEDSESAAEAAAEAVASAAEAAASAAAEVEAAAAVDAAASTQFHWNLTTPFVFEDAHDHVENFPAHPATAFEHALTYASVAPTVPRRNALTAAQVQCVEMDVRVPQLSQSVPRGHDANSDPEPPSSQSPSPAYEHVLVHVWPETMMKSMLKSMILKSIGKTARCICVHCKVDSAHDQRGDKGMVSSSEV